MRDSQQIRTRKIKLDLGTEEAGRLIETPFTHLRLSEESSANVVISVRLNEQANDVIVLTPGQRIENWPTEEMEVSWDAQVGESCYLQYWSGPISGPPRIVDDATTAQIVGDVGVAPGDTLDTTPDESVAATSTEIVLAANPNRKEAHVCNLKANTAVIRVGGVDTDAGEGVEVLPGVTYFLETSAAVYVYNSHTAAQSVGLSEVMKS